MTAINPTGIDTWPQFTSQSVAFDDAAGGGIDTTSSGVDVDPKWGQCIDALLGVRERAMLAGQSSEDSPSPAVVEAALQWLVFLRDRFPAAPPTLVGPEPAGGLIIERRVVAVGGGQEILEELTLENNGRAEMTVYVDGKVKEMMEVSFNPPAR